MSLHINVSFSTAFRSSFGWFFVIIIYWRISFATKNETLSLLLIISRISISLSSFCYASGWGCNSRQRCSQIFKELLYVYSHFCASFSEHSLKFISKCLSLFCTNLSFLSQIYFVTNNNDCYVVTSNVSRLLYPRSYVFKTLLWCDIVTNNSDLTIIDIGGDQRPKSFLSRRVP